MGMPRKRRLVVPGYPHHVTQRGNHRQAVFFSEHDRKFYLELLRRQVEKGEISVAGFALMTNHVHHGATPHTSDSLSRSMRALYRDFSRFQHLCHDQAGHLWQGRFFSCPVHDIWEVLAYIELNPVRAGMVADVRDWEWSSARAHLRGEDYSGLLDMNVWRKQFDRYSWKEYLTQAAVMTDVVHRIRRATRAGRFCGPEEIGKALELQFQGTIRKKSRD
jgi:putative transposase